MDKFEQHIRRMKNLQSVYEEGTGQHNILSMLINECEASLRQPPVRGSLQINLDDVYEEANHRSPAAFDEYVKSICNDR